MRYFIVKKFIVKKILLNIKNKERKKYLQEIDIAISTNSKFLRQTQILISSLENVNAKVNLHILNISLTDYEIQLIRKILPNNVKLNNIKLSAEELKQLKINKKWPIEAWARTLIPKLLTNKMVLYIDVDCIIVDDISELFKQDNITICGVKSPYYLRKKSSYIKQGVNSGFLMMNCKFLEKNHFTEHVLEYGKKNKNSLLMPDQDSINSVCKNYMMYLYPNYNVMNFMVGNSYLRITYNLREKYYKKSEILSAIYNPKVIHFNGGPLSRPWISNGRKNPYTAIYKYYDKKVEEKLNEF